MEIWYSGPGHHVYQDRDFGDFQSRDRVAEIPVAFAFDPIGTNLIEMFYSKVRCRTPGKLGKAIRV